MADYLQIFAAPDSHIEFIARHPETLYDYVEGERPSLAAPPREEPTLWQRITGNVPPPAPMPTIPDDWPTSEPKMIGPEINHRNVDLYHWILNGSPDFVSGSGSIFQTWLEAPSQRTHSAIVISDEDFAFRSEQLLDLAGLLERVDVQDVKTCFTQWLQKQGDTYEPSLQECEEMASEFASFAASTREAIDRSEGLIWTGG